jgi:hypothetical protein
MNRNILFFPRLFFLGLFLIPLLSFQNVPVVEFREQMIAAESAESVGVFDVNGDGVLDIVSGSYWYEGPSYLKRNFVGSVERVGEYFDDFSTIPLDVNGNGKVDFITGGWFNKALFWRENPGNDKEWTLHKIASTGNIETTRAWDINGNGFKEIVPNTPGDALAYYTLIRDENNRGTGQFSRIQVAEKHGHGLGFGDINGDGLGDFVISGGWLEAPSNQESTSWKLHSDFNLGDASVPIIVSDINQDGQADLIVGQAHNYGLDWYEQKNTGVGIEFIKHPIDPFQSQYHSMEWSDIDNDGQKELITGKRYRAHNGNDPGSNDPFGLYYFKWNGESFTKNIISYGPFGEGKGTGISFCIADLRNSGRKDIIVAGKDGLFVYFNEG